MKTNDFITEGHNLVQAATEMHTDHEIQMAREACYRSASNAIELHRMLKHVTEQEGLDAWASEKISLANDYLRTVKEWLEYELMTKLENRVAENQFEVFESTYNEIANQGVAEGYWADALKKAEADREARKGKPFEKNPASHDKDGVYQGDKDLAGNPVPKKKQGVAEGSLNEFSSDSEDDGYYKEYLRGYKDGKGYPEVVKSSKKREIWMTVTPKNPPLTEPYMRGWYDGKYGPAPGKDLIDLNKLNEQGVAEGLSDIVKGIKRKVAGKTDPKDVEHTYARIARRDIEDANKLNNQAAYDARDKSTKRWEKVNKVVNKEGMAEEIKGWKHAGRDLAQHRASLGKDVHLVLLKKDGTESKMNDAKKSFRSEDEARQYHERIKKLNPTRNIRHNLYVGDNVEKLD